MINGRMSEVSPHDKELPGAGRHNDAKYLPDTSTSVPDTSEGLIVAIDLSEQDAAPSDDTQHADGRIKPFGVGLMLRTCFRTATHPFESRTTKEVKVTRERGTHPTAPTTAGQNGDSIPAIVPDTEHYTNPND
jgi:hypothetical protein